MSCKKPCVVTNCSSLPELITPFKGGMLCRMDEVSDFVEKIRQLGNNSVLRKKMGEYNRQDVIKRFSLENMCERYNELYVGVLNGKKR